MAIRATPSDATRHTHHISLSDGVTTVGLNMVNSKGEPTIQALQGQPYPRSTIAVGSANGQLSERRAPYGEFSRVEWIGGLGMEDGEADSTRYWFGQRVWTASAGKIMLAPRLYHSKPYSYTQPGPLTMNEPQSNDYDNSVANAWETLSSGQLYLAAKWTNSAAQTVPDVFLVLDVSGSPTSVTVSICEDSGGSPGAAVASKAITVFMIGHERYKFTFSSYPALSAATDYWLVVTAAGTSASNVVRIWTRQNSSYTVKESADGSTWSASSNYAPVHTLINYSDWNDVEFLTYREAMIAGVRIGQDFTRTPDSAHLIQLGDRGACDSNALALDKLKDASKSWVTNQWKGCVVKIIEGPGADEWRVVESNDDKSLTVESDWFTEHTTASSYVIIGGGEWRETALATHGLTTYRSAIVSRQNVLYVAQGLNYNIRRLREYNNSGTWTVDSADDGTNKAHYLAFYQDADGNNVWRLTYQGYLSKAAEAAWATNLTFGTEEQMGEADEDSTALLIYEDKVLAFFSKSIWAYKDDSKSKLAPQLLMNDMNNGRRAKVMSPYIVFPYGNGVERLYNNLMEDFGPERDDGFPAMYAGTYKDFAPIPGGLLAIVDMGVQGAYMGDHVSGIYLYRNGGWHPVNTMPYELQLHGLNLLSMPNQKCFLYWGHRKGISYSRWPREFDYRKDTMFRLSDNLESDGYLITGWFYAGNKIIDKYWKDFTLHAYLPTGCSVELYYQTEDEDTTVRERQNLRSRWTYAATASTTSAVIHNLTLSATSRRIRFMLRLIGTGSDTPVVYGYNVEYLGRIEASTVYPVTTRSSDMGVDRVGVGEALGADEAITQLRTWAALITPLTMRCIISSYDNKSVLLEQPGIRVGWADNPLGRHMELISLQLIEA